MEISEVQKVWGLSNDFIHVAQGAAKLLKVKVRGWKKMSKNVSRVPNRHDGRNKRDGRTFPS